MTVPSFEMVVLTKTCLSQGFDMASIKSLAVNFGWELYEEGDGYTSFNIENRFSIFATQDDAMFYDHCCILLFFSDSCALSKQVDQAYGELQQAVEREFGNPALTGVWPKSNYDYFSVPYCYSIWRFADSILVVQQDDLDPQTGFDINVCVQKWGKEQPLPQNRRWRYRAK